MLTLQGTPKFLIDTMHLQFKGIYRTAFKEDNQEIKWAIEVIQVKDLFDLH